MTPTPAPPTSTALVVVAAAIACEERGLGLSRYQVLEVAKQDWRDGERSIPSLISIENFKIHEPKNGNRQPAGVPWKLHRSRARPAHTPARPHA